jgi:hypothetical protein
MDYQAGRGIGAPKGSLVLSALKVLKVRKVLLALKVRKVRKE